MYRQFYPKKVSSLLVFLLLGSGISKMQAQSKKIIPITLTQLATSTGIHFTQGQSVNITASGIMDWYTGQCDGACVATPAGIYENCVDGFPTPQFPCWSLIGRIGNGVVFEVGTTYSGYADSSGELVFGVNDNNYPDNSGNWQATVIVPDQPNTITAQVQDPFPYMITPSGTIYNDYNRLNNNKIVSGAATDGVTRVLIVANSQNPVTFSLNNNSKGYLSTLENQQPGTSPVIVAPQDGKAVAIYTVPDGIGAGYPPGGWDVQVNLTDTKQNKGQAVVTLVTPPVVLVHGMWSGPAAWQSFTAYLQAVGIPSNFISLADYSDHSQTTFNPNSDESVYGRMAVMNAIQSDFSNYRSSGIAVSQADVVAHSLGGLMTRSLTQILYSDNNFNLPVHYVHKLITLGTPHRGSPLGPELWNRLLDVYHGGKTIIPFTSFMEWINMPIGTVHKDFGITSAGIQALEATPPYKTYAVVGHYDDAPGLLLMNFIGNTFLSGPFDIIFRSRCSLFTRLPSDLIVPTYSQIGYINSTKTFEGVAHSKPPGLTTETNSSAIQNYVGQLLLSDLPGNFSSGFPSPSVQPLDCNTATERVIAETARKSTPSARVQDGHFIQITAPLPGTVFHLPNDSILNLKLVLQGGVKISGALVAVGGQNWYEVTDSTAYSASIVLPKNAPAGTLHVGAIAKDSNGAMLFDTISIQIVPAGNLKTLQAYPEKISLDSMVRERQVYTHGIFATSMDSSDIDLTKATTGTIYHSKHGGIFNVSADGLLNGIAVGKDTLIVVNGTTSREVPVSIDSNYFKFQPYPNPINFPAPADLPSGSDPFALQATAASGATVLFGIVSGPATVQSGVLTITGTGTITVKASEAGNAYFAKAPDVIRSFNVSSVLAVNFISVKASLFNQDGIVQWQTGSEINAKTFVVQRSNDGINFTPVGSVGAIGNSTISHDYSYTDLNIINLSAPKIYYRLQEADQDGNVQLSNIVSINVPGKLNAFVVYPNPANNYIRIIIPAYLQKPFTMRLFDMSGKLVAGQQTFPGSGSLNMSATNLASGVYHLTINDANTQLSEHKVIVTHY